MRVDSDVYCLLFWNLFLNEVKIIYRVPLDGKLLVYKLVKKTKKEMILKDHKGNLTRVTPGQFLDFAETPDAAVNRALNITARRLHWIKKEVTTLSERVAKLYEMSIHFTIKSNSGEA